LGCTAFAGDGLAHQATSVMAAAPLSSPLLATEKQPSIAENISSIAQDTLGAFGDASSDAREGEKTVGRAPCAFLVGMTLGAFMVYGLLLGTKFFQEFSAQRAMLPSGFYASVPPPQNVPEAYMRSQPLNNSCLLPTLDAPSTNGPQTFDACGFVIRSTDAVWNSRGNVDEAIEKYFREGYWNAGSWGKRGIGKKALRDAVFGEMRAFPDIKIHITDCLCRGNDNEGYKCAMPDVLEGTNLGPSAYGPATGRYARWTGLVESFVKKNEVTGQWQYVAEWGVHDEWALIQQLGLDFSRVPRPSTNTEPIQDCMSLVANFTANTAKASPSQKATGFLRP